MLLRTARQFARGNIPAVNPFSSSLIQLGGVFIIDSDSIVRLGQAATPVFTYPSVDTCLAVLDSMQVPASAVMHEESALAADANA